MVRGEHRAHDGQDGVVLLVGVRQPLGVRGLPGEAEPLGLGVAASALEQLGGQVGRDDPGSAPGGGDGGVAGAGGDVEDVRPRPDAGGLDELVAELGDDVVGDRGVMAFELLGIGG